MAKEGTFLRGNHAVLDAAEQQPADDTGAQGSGRRVRLTEFRAEVVGG